MKVLVIESSAAMRNMAEFYLESSGVKKVFTSANYVDGIDAAFEIRPDLILMGSEQDGQKALSALKILKKAFDTKTIPVMVWSRSGDADVTSRFISFGANCTMAVPAGFAFLKEKISALFPAFRAAV